MTIKYLVIAIILLSFFACSTAIARVLPVNEEADLQEDFILHNIDMPDLPGTSVEVANNSEEVQSEQLSYNGFKIMYFAQII
jgi:hypothetical protein